MKITDPSASDNALGALRWVGIIAFSLLCLPSFTFAVIHLINFWHIHRGNNLFLAKRSPVTLIYAAAAVFAPYFTLGAFLLAVALLCVPHVPGSYKALIWLVVGASLVATWFLLFASGFYPVE